MEDHCRFMFDPSNNICAVAALGRFTPGGAKPLMAMVEVTHRCNMVCPICFADSRPSAPDVPIEKIRTGLERLLKITETPIPLQISGGEPSVRNDLGRIIAMARGMGYRNIELITNGIRIAQDDTYLEALKTNGLTAVYLQFDGLRPETTLAIRGQDMTAIRHRAIGAIRKAGLCCSLAVVVTKGINDNEIGDIVQFGFDHIDVVRAINFQSAARFTGRFDLGKDYQGFDLDALLDLIEAQTGIGAGTFLSEHLGHAACNAMSVVFRVNGQLKPLFKYIDQEDVRKYLGAQRRNKILAAFAGKKDFFYRHLLNPAAWKMLAKAAPIFGTNPYNVLKRDHLLLFAKAFMETSRLDTERISKCCYAVTTEKGVFSFCAYNSLYRFVEG